MNVLLRLEHLVNNLSALFNESYFMVMVLAIIMVILLLTYLILKYKKALKSLKAQIIEKDEKIKTLRQYAYEHELKRKDREHEVEKTILALEHTIEALKTKEKEGLKSQVVLKIEAAQNRRERELKRVNLSY